MALVLALGQSGSGPSPDSGLMYWGFDKIFVARSTASPQHDWIPILSGDVADISSVSVSSQWLVVAGRLKGARRPTANVFSTTDHRLIGNFGQDVYRVALSPQGRQLAATSPDPHADGNVVIKIWDLPSGPEKDEIQISAAAGATLTWRPDGKQIAFDSRFVESQKTELGTDLVTSTYRSLVDTIDIATGQMAKVSTGASPSWSPDGASLVYYADRSLFRLDLRSKQSTLLMRRQATEPDFTGPLSWSSDGRYVAANAKAGQMNELLECYIVDVAAGRVRSLGTSSYTCGPWLADSSVPVH
jgi:WD40 repeat protein